MLPYLIYGKRPKRKKIDIRFGTWNVKSLYRVGPLRTVAEEVSENKLDYFLLIPSGEQGRDGTPVFLLILFPYGE
jgi:hypothetical protein